MQRDGGNQRKGQKFTQLFTLQTRAPKQIIQMSANLHQYSSILPQGTTFI